MLNKEIFIDSNKVKNYELGQMNIMLTAILDKVEALEKKMIPQEDYEYLDSKSAARLMGISLRTIMSYKQTGKINFSKVGGKLYFKRTDLLNVINDAKIKYE